MQDLPARDGTPFERIVTREWIEMSPGMQEPRSIAQVRITTPEQTTISVIRALPGIGGPSDKEMRRRAKTRARAVAAAEARIEAEVGKRIGWGWCSSHEEADVTLRGHCSKCGEVVGERMMTAAEFKILNPEIRNSATQPPLPVDVVTTPAVIRDSGSTPVSLADRRAGLFDQDEDTPHTIAIDVGPPEQATQGQREPWRCYCDCGCRAFERHPKDPRPGERWRCEGCGHGEVTPASVAAIAGGSDG
jgi:hypothetical protein